MSVRPDSSLQPAPFSDDFGAFEIFSDCDFCPITFEDAKSGKADRPIRVCAVGVFDLIHIGHANMLQQAKRAFPNVHLIAGVLSRETCMRVKGANVQSNETRCEAVRHLKHVDEVLPNFPFDDMTRETLQKLKIDFVAHDADPYLVGGEDRFKKLKDAGCFLATSRTSGISTTEIVARIIEKFGKSP